MTDTKAYGWAVAAIHHVVFLGVGGRQEESELEMVVGDGQAVFLWGGGGGLTIVEEALRCFCEEFFFLPIPHCN